MASIEQLSTALRNAHAAGDIEAARKIAAVLQSVRGTPSLGSFQTAPRGDEEAGFFENITSGFGAGAVGMAETASLGAATLLEEESELAAREKIKAAANYLRPEGGDSDSISYKLASGLGSIVGLAAPAALAAYAAPAAATTAVGLGVAGALGIGAGAGEASERARDFGATEEDRNAAILRGAAIGSLDAIPLGRVIRIPGVTDLMEKLGGEGVGLVNRIRSAAVSGSVEGVQEATTAILQNLNERGYNAEAELINAGVLEEGAVGAGSGAIFQGVIDLFVKGKSRKGGTTEPTELGPAPEVEQPRLEEGQVQGELFPSRVEPSTVEQGTDYGSALTDFADEQVTAAVDKLRASNVDPATITEDMVFDTITNTPEIMALAPTAETTAETTVRDDRTPDMIDRMETQQLKEMEQRELDDTEIAEIESYLKADEEAVRDLEKVRGASQQETDMAAQKDEARADRTRPREAALDAVIGEPTTGSYVNLERKFAKELERRNIASGERAKPTKQEVARIRRAADAFAGMRPQEEVKPAPPEVGAPIETAPEATQLSEMEARIPEAKAAVQPQSQLSFPGMGRRKTPPVKETAPEPKTVTKEFMDGLGIAQAAPIRKRVTGKDLNATEVRDQFVVFANNQKVPEQTRLNVARELEGTPDAQLELFQPKPRGRKQDEAPQPTTSGAGVPTATPTLDFKRLEPLEGRDAQRPTTSKRSGVGVSGARVANPASREVETQLTLDLPEPIAEAPEKVSRETKRKPKGKRVSKKAPVVAAKTSKEVTPKKVEQPETTSTVRKTMPVLQIEKTTPVLAPTRSNAEKQLTERFEAQSPEVRRTATEVSQVYENTVGKDITNPDDRLKVLTLVTEGATARDKEGNAAVTYLGKVERPIDGLYLAIFDVANQTPQFRKTIDMPQGDVEFYSGMGKKPAQLTLDWAKKNLSKETNAWIDATLEKEIRDIERINNTDYIEMFRAREAKLAVKEAAEQAQFDAEMRQDLRSNIDELARMFEMKITRNAVVAMDAPMHPRAKVLMRRGDLKGALRAISVTTNNNKLAQVAGKLADVVDSVTVKDGKLSMSRDARVTRAKEQGFDTTTTYYHGTNVDFTRFSKQELGEATGAKDAQMGFFFASNPTVASTYADTSSAYTEGFVGAINKFTRGAYKKVNEALLGTMGKTAEVTGGRVMPVYLRMENPMVVDHKGKAYDEAEYTSILERAYKNGHDGVVIKNTRDEGFVDGGTQTTDISIVFDSANIESVNAPFDPVDRGRTQLEIVENLKDAQGNPVAGLFDPETNTIKIDQETGTNTHVLLHEMTHAATSATLANKNHPLTRQLTKLYEDTKDMIDGAYGAISLDEFVSEAFSNPEFQKKLATMNVKGEEISALQRFFNSVGNFLRKLVGMQTKSIDSALTEADRLIEAILAPAPDSRNAGELLMNSTRSGVKQKMKDIGDIQRELALPLTDKFRGEWGDGAAQWIRNAGDTVRWVLPKLTGSQALGDIAKAVGLGDLGLRLHRSYELQRGAMNQSDERVQQKVRIADKWANKVGKDKQDNLNNLIYSEDYGATIYQVDPTLTRAQARKKYEGNTDASGNPLFKVWEAQRKDWDALGSEGQNVYKTMRDMYREQYNELKDVIYGRIDDAMKDNPEAAATLKKEVYAKLFESGTLDVYFPLMREGKYSLAFSYKPNRTKNERDQYVVQMFDNYRERDRAAKMLAEDADVDQSTISTKDGALEISDYTNVPATTFVGQTLKTLKDNKVDPDVQAEIMRLFIEALPESSFAKSLQKRKGTPGYMKDAIYAMRTKGYDLGRQIERMRYSAIIRGIEDEISEAQPPADGGKGKGIIPAFDTVRAELLVRSKFARQGAAFKGLEKYVRTINQLAFVYTIGANAASAAVNLSQIPLFVYPYLGAKYGYAATGAAIKEASAIVSGSKIGSDSGSFTGKALDKITLAYGIDAYYDVKNGDYRVRTDLNLDPELVKRLETMAPLVKVASARGQLTRSYLLDALGLEEGGRQARGNKLQRALDIGTGISAMMFNQAERFNRQVTLIASYNLALAKAKKDNPNMSSTKQQELAAEEALYETQQTNGGSVLETAPRIAQENIGRVASMYKTYGMQMYYTMLKSGRVALDAFAKDKKFTAEERKIALKQIAGLHGTAMFFAGIHGVPLYGAVQLLADLILFDDEDDKFDDVVRKAVGEGWYKGAFTELTGIDIANRVRLTGLLIQENRYNNDPSTEEFIGYYLGGPALSVGKRFGRGVSDLWNGETQRGIESMMPAGIANMYKASPIGRYQQEEGIYTRRGDPIYDDMTSGDLLSQFIGFAPSEYTRVQEINQRDKRVEGAVISRRSNLLKKYYIAVRMGDLAGMEEAQEGIAKFNDRHPTARIDRASIKKSLKSHRSTSKKMYNGVTISPLMQFAIQESRLEYDQGFNFFSGD